MSKSRGKHAKGKSPKVKKSKDPKVIDEQAAPEAPDSAEGDAPDADAIKASDAFAGEGVASSAAENISDDSTRALSPVEKAHVRESVIDGSGAYNSFEHDAFQFGAVSPATSAEGKEKKKTDSKKVKKILALVFGSIAGLLVATYLVGIAIFSNWFFPATSIGAIDASMRSSAEVAAQLPQNINAHGQGEIAEAPLGCQVAMGVLGLVQRAGQNLIARVVGILRDDIGAALQRRPFAGVDAPALKII